MKLWSFIVLGAFLVFNLLAAVPASSNMDGLDTAIASNTADTSVEDAAEDEAMTEEDDPMLEEESSEDPVEDPEEIVEEEGITAEEDAGNISE